MQAYAHFLQPISRLILHNTNLDSEGEPIEPRRPWEYWHPLVNISIAHNECSIACPRDLAVELFAPVISGLKPEIATLLEPFEDASKQTVILSVCHSKPYEKFQRK